MKKTDKNGKHKKTSRIGEVWHQLKKNKIAVASLIVLILIILVAILAPLLALTAMSSSSAPSRSASRRQSICSEPTRWAGTSSAA